MFVPLFQFSDPQRQPHLSRLEDVLGVAADEPLGLWFPSLSQLKAHLGPQEMRTRVGRFFNHAIASRSQRQGLRRLSWFNPVPSCVFQSRDLLSSARSGVPLDEQNVPLCIDRHAGGPRAFNNAGAQGFTNLSVAVIETPNSKFTHTSPSSYR